MQTTMQAPRPITLDPARIASISGAIAVNGLVLLLLLAPMAPVIQQIRDSDPIVDFVVVKHDPPPPPPEPIPVEVRRTTASVPRTPTQPVQVQTPQPPIDGPAQPDDYRVPPAAEVIGPVVPPPPIVEPGQPLAGAHLEYAVAPAPPYPRESLLGNETGTVMLEVLVDVDGRPIDVRIARSSGHRQLDLAAKRQVLAKWRFKPAMRDGQAVQAIGLVPVDFTLN